MKSEYMFAIIDTGKANVCSKINSLPFREAVCDVQYKRNSEKNRLSVLVYQYGRGYAVDVEDTG